MEFLNHGPLEGEKFQVMGRIMGFGLFQTLTGIGNDSICTINMSLVEDRPQARPTSISMEFKRFGEIGISKNRFIKGPLTPVILHDNCFLLAPIFT